MSKAKHNNLITKANKVYNPIAGFDKEIIQWSKPHFLITLESKNIVGNYIYNIF